MSQNDRVRIVAAYFAYFVCLSVLVSLGAWQVARGLHKAQIENLVGLSAGQALQDGDVEDLSSLDHVRVRFRGKMDHAHAFYLDNRVYRGRIGYEVFVPFEVEQADFSLLVNRGWVAKDQAAQVGEKAVRPSHAPGNIRAPVPSRSGFYAWSRLRRTGALAGNDPVSGYPGAIEVAGR